MRPKADKFGVVHYRLRLHFAPLKTEAAKRQFLFKISLPKAIQPQIDFALCLLHQAGYPLDLVDESFQDFELPIQENGSVHNWLANLTVREIGDLIDLLKTICQNEELFWHRIESEI
jgi:hypothetical protein